MSSLSRNTHRANSPVRLRALSTGLALALASGAALADGAHRFVFTAYSDAAGGPEVVSGRYRAALQALESHPDTMDLDPSAANTNRCVAFSMTLQWRQARAACDAAVHAASAQITGVPTWLRGIRQSQNEYLALAYTNRAVMHWMSRDGEAAEDDLGKARALAPQANFVARNVAALAAHVTVARATVPAPKS